MLDAIRASTINTPYRRPVIVNNPVANFEFPDPCVIRYKDKLIGYATSNVGYQNIQMAQCSIFDLNSWQRFNKGALKYFPKWILPSKGIWAPHVIDLMREENEFRIYYSGTCARNYKQMGSGVSKSKTPFDFEGNYEHIVVDDGYRAIDTCFFRDYKTNRDYLFYGSKFDSIQAIELNSEGTKKAFGAKHYDIVAPYVKCNSKGKCAQGRKCIYGKLCRWHRQYEGVFVKYNKHLQKYFLWISSGGWHDRYALLVFESNHILGPYKPLNNGYPVLRSNKYFRRPGQNMTFELNGREWTCYHANPLNQPFVKGTNHKNRVLCLEPVTYHNGIPFVGKSTPSSLVQIY